MRRPYDKNLIWFFYDNDILYIKYTFVGNKVAMTYIFLTISEISLFSISIPQQTTKVTKKKRLKKFSNCIENKYTVSNIIKTKKINKLKTIGQIQ